MLNIRKIDDKIFTGIYNLELLAAIDRAIYDAVKLIKPVFVKTYAKYERLDRFCYVRLDPNGEGYVKLPTISSIIMKRKLYGVVDNIQDNIQFDCSDDLLRLIIKARRLSLESTLKSVDFENNPNGFIRYTGDDCNYYIKELKADYFPLAIIDDFWMSYQCEAKIEAAKKVGVPFDAFEQALFKPVWEKYILTVDGVDKRKTTMSAVGKALNGLKFFDSRSKLM